MNRLQLWYEKVLQRDLLHKNFIYIENMRLNTLANTHLACLPKLRKVILNIGLREAKMNNFGPLPAAALLSLIAGQRVVITHAKVAISEFRLQAGMPIGCKVILRKDSLFYFLDTLQSTVLPRLIDFWGFNLTQVNAQGQLNFGLPSIFLFPGIQELENTLCTVYSFSSSTSGVQKRSMFQRDDKHKVGAIHKKEKKMTRGILGLDVTIHSQSDKNTALMLFSGIRYPLK
uniref:Ribosomal protein L5 n=1 Tax=Goniomonas avonlea TaxID=1255295 RepID=A0A348G6N7_9CRYP|nr:ribosomal protein L5 [Goniomonas avonlea]